MWYRDELSGRCVVMSHRHVVTLSPSASFVWNHIDGIRSVDDIARAYQEHHADVDNGFALRIVTSTLEILDGYDTIATDWKPL